MSPVILLHPDDNVLVCRARIEAGATLSIDNDAVTTETAVEVGHKLARVDLRTGDRVYKYGAPIGSMTAPVSRGGHVHMHNMKSDYIPSHTRNATGGQHA